MAHEKGKTAADADTHVLLKEWDEISCPICMDHPHNAVLLICSSYDKGCRSYICDTSYRHSNCLDRFRKLKANHIDTSSLPSASLGDNSESERLGQGNPRSAEPLLDESRMIISQVETNEHHHLGEASNTISAGYFEANGENNDDGSNDNVNSNSNNNNRQEVDEYLEAQGGERNPLEESGGGDEAEPNCLKCPLCRGTVISWIIVKEARQYLDLKPRSCSRESCSFSGSYRELRRHARRIHPSTRPADVDPSRQRAWRRLEHQREYGDILSAIRSAMPGAIVLGDYVIDNGDLLSRDRGGSGSGEGNGPWWTTFFLFHMISSPVGSIEEPRSSSRAWRTHRRRNLWSEQLLNLPDEDDGEGNQDNDDIPVPRRRRRLLRSRPDEEQS